jgi:hypothetical protein
MPKVDARDSTEQLEILAASLNTVELTGPQYGEKSPENQLNTLIVAARDRRGTLLETAVLLKSPRGWEPGEKYDFNVGPGNLSIEVGERSQEVTSKISYRRKQNGTLLVDSATFDSPHIGKNAFSRLSESVIMPLSKRRHRAFDGVEFFLEGWSIGGRLSRTVEDETAKIETTFDFRQADEVRRGLLSDIRQEYVPKHLPSEQRKISLFIQDPNSLALVNNYPAIPSKTGVGVKVGGTVIVSYDLTIGGLTAIEESVRGFKEEVTAQQPNVLLVTDAEIVATQERMRFLPGKINPSAVFTNIAMGRFALDGIWAPDMG